MNRLRAVCRDAIGRHAIGYAISCVAVPYVDLREQGLYAANISCVDGYLIFARSGVQATQRPSYMPESWFQL